MRVPVLLNRPVQHPELWGSALVCSSCNWNQSPIGPWLRCQVFFPPKQCPICGSRLRVKTTCARCGTEHQGRRLSHTLRPKVFGVVGGVEAAAFCWTNGATQYIDSTPGPFTKSPRNGCVTSNQLPAVRRYASADHASSINTRFASSITSRQVSESSIASNVFGSCRTRAS